MCRSQDQLLLNKCSPLSLYPPSGIFSRGRRGGVFCGGYTPTILNVIDFITIPSTGNAVDYGDLTAVSRLPGVTSNSIRAVAAGGETPSFVDTIEYFSIPTGGTVTDFGDTTLGRVSSGPLSNAHGGLNDGNQGVVDTT